MSRMGVSFLGRCGNFEGWKSMGGPVAGRPCPRGQETESLRSNTASRSAESTGGSASWTLKSVVRVLGQRDQNHISTNSSICP